MRRRAFLAGSAGVLAAGCGHVDGLPHPAPPNASLIDLHNHCFNVTDLPARRFIKIVVLDHFQDAAPDERSLRSDEDVVDWLIELLVGFVAVGAPTAAQELAQLSERRLTPANWRSEERAAEDAAVEGVARFLGGEEGRAGSGRSDLSPRGRLALRAQVLRAGGLTDRGDRIGPSQALRYARRAFRSATLIGRYLRWFALFSRSRASLVDQLAANIRGDGFRPAMLSPALIDYSHWLDQETQSPLVDQIRVMAAVAARSGGAAVHGYVAFDPLRQAYDEANGVSQDALTVSRAALVEHGFLGVKVYPPMGFRACDNGVEAQLYPARVVRDLGGGTEGSNVLARDGTDAPVGRALDRALRGLYALCEEVDAPILTHAGRSNGAGAGFELRADPYYWIKVLRAHPRLRVCLGHYSGGVGPSVGRDHLDPPLNSWGWAVGDVEPEVAGRLFMDLSYVSAVLSTSASRLVVADNLKAWISAFDRDCRRLVFGSDWIMLGKEHRSKNYARAMDAFLGEDVGLSQTNRQRIFHDNAIAFSGLGGGTDARRRLEAFYAMRNLDPARLPVASA